MVIIQIKPGNIAREEIQNEKESLVQFLTEKESITTILCQVFKKN
jgi:hypothetical protein